MQKLLISLSLAVILSISAFGQKNKNASISAVTSLDAQLQKTLDVKNAKVGDEVVLKVTQNIKQNGEVIVPKGTKIIGSVTEVQERTGANAMSKIGVLFNRLEGQSLNSPINATITSITNVAANASANNDSFESDSSVNSNTTGTVSQRNSNSGGLLGGVGNTVGGVVNTTTNTAGNVTNTIGNKVDSTTKTVGNAVNGINISQSTDVSASGSTTLSTRNKNLKVEKGATFRLSVSEAIEK